VSRKLGGFKAHEPVWVAHAVGTLADCIRSNNPPTEEFSRCEASSSGYIAVPDDLDHPTATILTGKRTHTLWNSAAADCTLPQPEQRISCRSPAREPNDVARQSVDARGSKRRV
jgi:hypothetical protein